MPPIIFVPQPAKPPFPVTVDWKTCTVSSEDSSSRHAPSGSGCYVVKLSPTARVAAVAVNHNTAADTHILFMDLWNEVSVTSPVYLKTDSKMTGRCGYIFCTMKYLIFKIQNNIEWFCWRQACALFFVSKILFFIIYIVQLNFRKSLPNLCS